MKRYLIETPHSPENCTLVIYEVHAMGYLNYFEWGCEAGVHCGWGFVEAEDEQQATMTVPSVVRRDARAVEVTKFGPARAAGIHSG